MNTNPNVLKDFFNISHWQTVLILLFLILSFITLWYLTKRFKLKFHWRVLIGLGMGVVMGIAISGSAGFPDTNQFDNKTRWGSYEYGYEANQWFGLISSIFISGLMIMILPIIFLSMARIMSKQTKSNLSAVTWKGIIILLINVAVAFTITFWLGYVLDIGRGFFIEEDVTNTVEPLKSLTTIISEYMPNNFFKVISTLVIVPVLVLGAIVGYAIKKSSKGHPEQMKKSRENLNRYWTISISVLMFIIKFMPYAVIAMISKALFSRPIGEFAAIGGLIGLGYLGIVLAYGWHVLTVWIFGISPTKFIKRGFKPVLTGFLTQSSIATLPIAMESLKYDMKLGEKAASPNVVMPLSTTLGLTGCAGVQSGVILTLLLHATNSPVHFDVGIFYLLGLIVTLFVSLGVAGVPGTATIVTIGLISTLGYSGFVTGTINVLAPLNGIFDMGRTAVNTNGGLQASLITSSLEKELPSEMKTKGLIKIILNKFKRKLKRKK